MVYVRERERAHGGLRAAVDVQASEQDLNMDGKMDVIDIKATARGLGDVYGVKALMAFDYAVDGRVDLALNGLAVAQHASPLPGSGYYVDGYLRLRQRTRSRREPRGWSTTTPCFPLRSTARWSATRAKPRRCACP